MMLQRQAVPVLDVDATPLEREALARFYSDALFEVGSDSVRIPKLDELTDLLSAIRLS